MPKDLTKFDVVLAFDFEDTIPVIVIIGLILLGIFLVVHARSASPVL